MKINFYYKIIIISTFFIGLGLRIYMVFNEGIFVDEAVSLPLSVLYFANPLKLSFVERNALKPEFYLLFYGFWLYILNGLHLQAIHYYIYVSYLPPSYLIEERFLTLILNYIVLIIFIKSFYQKNKNFVLSFVILYSFFIPIEFSNILISTSGLFIAFFLLFIIFITKYNKYYLKDVVIISSVFGILMSIQYYSIIIIIIPFLFLLLQKRSVKFMLKFYIIFILFSFLTFLLLNPIFILHFPIMLHEMFIDTSTVLSTSSGVVGIPVFLFGKIIFNVPIYTPLIMIFLEMPIAILIFMLFGMYLFIISLFYKYKVYKEDTCIDNLFIISIMIFFIFILFDVGLNYLRRNISILYIPILLIASVGSSKFIEYIDTLTSRNKIPNQTNNIRKVIVLFIILIFIFSSLAWSSIENQNNMPTYTNNLAYEFGIGGPNFQGALNSAQADKYVGIYIENHKLSNKTILSLALTDMIIYYAPSNSYIQWWATFNLSDINEFKGDYIVVDEWYAQLYSNPINEYPKDFNVIYNYHLNGGYAELAQIK